MIIDIITVLLAIVTLLLFLKRDKDYTTLKIHHEAMVKLWQRHSIEIITAYVASYFKDTPVTNYVVRLKHNKEIEILIGDEYNLVEVNTKNDIVDSLEEAYLVFLNKVDNV